MKLTTVKPPEGENKVISWHDFRLFDDNGEPMRWVKSVSFKLDPSQGPPVVMVIERYVTRDDEIDLDLDPSMDGVKIQIENIKTDRHPEPFEGKTVP